jgi:hypothetical protein
MNSIYTPFLRAKRLERYYRLLELIGLISMVTLIASFIQQLRFAKNIYVGIIHLNQSYGHAYNAVLKVLGIISTFVNIYRSIVYSIFNLLPLAIPLYVNRHFYYVIDLIFCELLV